MIKAMIITIAVLSGAILAQGTSNNIPVLIDGDVLLCSEWPYRTVRETDWTMYQLARLGFSSAREFQDKHRLKTDNVIGPETQRAINTAYQAGVGPVSTLQAGSTPLAMSAAFVTNGETCLLRVTISNISARAIRIRGELRTDQSDRITWSEPSVTARGKVDTRDGGRIALSSWALKTGLCASDTVLKPNDHIGQTVEVTRLKPNQNGCASVCARFIDANGVVHELTSELGSIPKEKDVHNQPVEGTR